MENLEADLVIIGAGAAGVPAALTALDNGVKKIIVLEKRFAPGGDALQANWMWAVETHLQKEKGVKLTADDIYKQALQFHRYDRVNPRILRTLIKRTADTIHWLEKKGVEFELRPQGTDPREHDWSTATGHWTKGSPFPDSLCSFGWVFKHLTKQCREGGAQFLFRTSGKKILRKANGEITGVLARTRAGQEFEIKTKSVILCPGSFTGNKEMLKKYFPYYYDEKVYQTASLPTNTGDGVQMAADAGAALAPTCCLIRHAMTFFRGGVNGRGHEGAQPIGIRVNTLGQRYLAETDRDMSGNILLQQPGKIGYVLYDDKIVQTIADRKTPPKYARIIPPPESIPDFRQFLQKQATYNLSVKKADTWDEIAKWIGCDPKVLKATIDRYNSFCDKGYDDDFVKDPKCLMPLRTPPYYAITMMPLMIEAIGPVKVNEYMEVLDKEDKSIPGFYAAGVLTSGWESYDYGGTPAGTAMGFSIGSGRIAAESASKYVQGK